MTSCDADPCLFMGDSNGDSVLILVNVDDLLVDATTSAVADAVEAEITDEFKSRKMREPTYFPGLHVDRNKNAGTIALCQRQYITSLLERFGMDSSIPVRLPMGAGTRLRQEGEVLPVDLVKIYQE